VELPSRVAFAVGSEARRAPRELAQTRRLRPGRNGTEHDEDKGKRRQPAQVAPQFATVKEGLIGRHLTFVPLGGIKVGPDDLQVAVTKQ
jgi:hypothetical protein